ncbi:MAG: recombination regulator RecX [Firmicutes bacterium]|nr:recombination regulator RecX [Bacillota bacterium]
MDQPGTKEAYLYALRLLAQRDLSAEEMRRRLLQRHFGTDTVNVVMQHLVTEGAINDLRVARETIAFAVQRARSGPLVIRRKLAQRGIDSDIIDAAWNDGTVDVNWLAIAEAIKERYDMRDPRQRARCARYLDRQGFPSSVIRVVMATEESPEKEKDTWL